VEDVTVAEFLGGSGREVVEEVVEMQQLCEISEIPYRCEIGFPFFICKLGLPPLPARLRRHLHLNRTLLF